MSVPRQIRTRPSRRRSRVPVVVLGLALAFAIGIALGESLHDNPASGGTDTFVRTLAPLQLPPAARTTVTIGSR
jgi:hypothetical protein